MQPNSKSHAVRKLIDEISVSVPVMWRQNYVRAGAGLPARAQAGIAAPSRQEGIRRTNGARARGGSAHREGKSNREIADLLVVGERTIETHVGNILSKLGFTSRTQIAAWSVEIGLGKTAQ